MLAVLEVALLMRGQRLPERRRHRFAELGRRLEREQPQAGADICTHGDGPSFDAGAKRASVSITSWSEVWRKSA